MPLVRRRLHWQDAKSPPAQLRLTYLIAQKHEPQFRRAFNAGVNDVADAMPDIEKVLEAGGRASTVLELYPDPTLAENAELWARIVDRYRKAYASTVEESAEMNWRKLLQRTGNVEKRDVVEKRDQQRIDETADYVERQVGDQIVMISSGQRAAIKVMTQAGIDAGLNPRVVARNVREVIGLLPREAEMVERRRLMLVEQGLPAKRVEALTSRYSKQKLRQRAERIARTEMIDAESFGRLAAWKEGQRSGLIRQDAYRVWIAAGPPRTCPICEALDGQVTERLTGDFTAEYEVGKGDNVRTVTVIRERPPAHPMCRCTDELVIP